MHWFCRVFDCSQLWCRYIKTSRMAFPPFLPGPLLSTPHAFSLPCTTIHTASNRPRCEGTAGYSRKLVCARVIYPAAYGPNGSWQPPQGYSVTISYLHPVIFCRAVRRSAGWQSETAKVIHPQSSLVYAQTRLNPALCPTPFLPCHPAVKQSSPLRRQGGSEFKPLNHAVSSLAVFAFSTVDVFVILLWKRP